MIQGKSVYGTPRATWAEAEADLPFLATSQTSAPAILTLQDWAYQQSTGVYGKGLAPRSQETNETYRLRFLQDQPLGQTPLDQITPIQLREFFTSLQAERRRKVGEVIEVTLIPASPRYKHRIKAYFSKLFSLAVESGLIASNPCLLVKLPTIPERDNTHATLEQILAFTQGSSRIHGIATLCALAGLRPSEARLLTWDKVDKENGQILQPGSKTWASKKPVPLPQPALQIIEAQPKRSLFIFTTQDGRPLSQWRLRTDWQKLKAELGLPKTLRLQDLRGTYVSLLIQDGADVRTTMELARHSTPTTTLQAYARTNDSARRAAQNSLIEKLNQSQLGHKTRAQNKKI